VLPAGRFDKRTKEWRRRCELVEIYKAALGGSVTPLLSVKIANAAEMAVIAETARADYMDGRKASLVSSVRRTPLRAR
jgi:hypothetical protein